MREYLQILIFIIMGIALLWFGYSLYSAQWINIRRKMKPRAKWRPKREVANPGDPKTCPVCKSKLAHGELVQTHAYPSITGGRDRLMYIQGCVYCINGDFERICPVCANSLSAKDRLVARMFDRARRRHHVHVLGCFHCRRKGMNE